MPIRSFFSVTITPFLQQNPLEMNEPYIYMHESSFLCFKTIINHLQKTRRFKSENGIIKVRN